MELLDHPVAGVRRWTIRLLGDDHRMNSESPGASSIGLAATEPDAMVRSQLASSCQRWDAGDALPILGRLARRDEDRRDPHIPNLLWWAFERQLRQDRDAVVASLSTAELQRPPLVTDAVLERTARALASEGSDARLRGVCPPAGRRARERADGADPGRDGRGARGPEAGAGARRRWRTRWRGSGPRRSRTRAWS